MTGNSLRQSKEELLIREKLLAYTRSTKPQVVTDKTVISQDDHFILRKFEPTGVQQISKKIKKALKKLGQGKELDVLTQQNIVGMLSNLSAQQLNEIVCGEKSANPTMLHLQLLNLTNKQLENDLQYSCYISGLKKHFKTIGLSAK